MRTLPFSPADTLRSALLAALGLPVLAACGGTVVMKESPSTGAGGTGVGGSGGAGTGGIVGSGGWVNTGGATGGVVGLTCRVSSDQELLGNCLFGSV